MLRTIQKYYPISWEDVKSVWKILLSYDDVIMAIEYSNSNGIDYITGAHNLV